MLAVAELEEPLEMGQISGHLPQLSVLAWRSKEATGAFCAA